MNMHEGTLDAGAKRKPCLGSGCVAVMLMREFGWSHLIQKLMMVGAATSHSGAKQKTMWH